MARHGVITETGHKAAAVLHAALSLSRGGKWSVNSLLLSIGIQWISDVFKARLQKLDSVTHRHLSIPFRLFRI